MYSLIAASSDGPRYFKRSANACSLHVGYIRSPATRAAFYTRGREFPPCTSASPNRAADKPEDEGQQCHLNPPNGLTSGPNGPASLPSRSPSRPR